MMRLAAVVLGAMLVLAGYGFAFFPSVSPVAPWLLVCGIAMLLASLLWLGIATESLAGGRGRMAIVLGLFLVLMGGLGGALLPGVAQDRLILGLPRRAALLLYGVGLAPGLLFGLAFAAGFDRLVLDRAGLETLRKEIARGRDPDPS